MKKKDNFRAELVKMLRILLGLTLTCNNDSNTISRNHVNVSLSAMSQTLYALGTMIYCVSFFGMKWHLTAAEPILDRFIERY